MSYSPFFQTLHDELRPVGTLGRGTHYSVLRVPIWQDEWGNPLSHGALLDFSVIWDEDHDERVIEAISELYFRGLLAPVRFIGERKGSLTLLLDAKTLDRWDGAALKSYGYAVGEVSQGLEDAWTATVDAVLGHDHSIIHAPHESVSVYLQNIQMLWQLGQKTIKQIAATKSPQSHNSDSAVGESF